MSKFIFLCVSIFFVSNRVYFMSDRVYPCLKSYVWPCLFFHKRVYFFYTKACAHNTHKAINTRWLSNPGRDQPQTDPKMTPKTPRPRQTDERTQIYIFNLWANSRRTARTCIISRGWIIRMTFWAPFGNRFK